MRRFVPALCCAAAGVVSLASACGGPNACSSDSDCFMGERCLDQECQAASSSNSSVNNVNSANSSNSSNSSNAASNSSQNSASGVCIADPFEVSCESDDNDTFGDYLRMETGRGCSSSDNFEGGEFVEEGLTMCPLESIDKYSTNLLPCDNVTFVVEVTVTPVQDCDPDDWDLNVRLQGNDCVEPNGKVQCQTNADGSKQVTAFLEPSISIAIPYIDVTSTRENVHFDYSVKIVTRN